MHFFLKFFEQISTSIFIGLCVKLGNHAHIFSSSQDKKHQNTSQTNANRERHFLPSKRKVLKGNSDFPIISSNVTNVASFKQLQADSRNVMTFQYIPFEDWHNREMICNCQECCHISIKKENYWVMGHFYFQYDERFSFQFNFVFSTDLLGLWLDVEMISNMEQILVIVPLFTVNKSPFDFYTFVLNECSLLSEYLRKSFLVCLL